MTYRGDFHKGATARILFTTVQATGAPTTLAGTPVVSAYEDGNTVEITAGITLTVDFDARTGLNLLAVDTSNAAFSAGKDYTLVITTGTVNGVSVVGYVIGAFSVENRKGELYSLLKQDMSAISGEAARSPINALRALRNKVDFPGGIVYKEDDTTSAWTFATTTAASGNIITVVDPA